MGEYYTTELSTLFSIDILRLRSVVNEMNITDCVSVTESIKAIVILSLQALHPRPSNFSDHHIYSVELRYFVEPLSYADTVELFTVSLTFIFFSGGCARAGASSHGGRPPYSAFVQHHVAPAIGDSLPAVRKGLFSNSAEP